MSSSTESASQQVNGTTTSHADTRSALPTTIPMSFFGGPVGEQRILPFHSQRVSPTESICKPTPSLPTWEELMQHILERSKISTVALQELLASKQLLIIDTKKELTNI